MQGSNIVETSILSGVMLIFYIILGRSMGVDTWVVITYPIVAALVWAYNNVITLRIYNEQHNYNRELHSRVWYLYVMKAFKYTYIALILSIIHHLANLDTYEQFFMFLKLDMYYILLFTIVILAINRPTRANKLR